MPRDESDTTWVTAVAYQRQLLGPKLGGSGLGEAAKNWDPYLFLQPLKLATSYLYRTLKTTCRQKLEDQKIL